MSYHYLVHTTQLITLLLTQGGHGRPVLKVPPTTDHHQNYQKYHKQTQHLY